MDEREREKKNCICKGKRAEPKIFTLSNKIFFIVYRQLLIFITNIYRERDQR